MNLSLCGEQRAEVFPEHGDTKTLHPGDRVTYIGPHVEGYLPALETGIVEHVGLTRSAVKYPWGCHLILNERMAIVERKPDLVLQ